MLNPTSLSVVALYAVGSPLVVDFEETLARAGVRVGAAVRNMEGEIYLLDRAPLVGVNELTGETKALPFLVPLFTPAHRQKAALEACGNGFETPFSIIDPTVASPRAITLGRGVYVNAGCSLGAGSEFSDFVLVNRGASIGHHARLGRFVSIGPGAVLAGGITVGHGTMIGSGAVVLPKVTIGANAVIGAGAVVTKDVPEHCAVVGNPARVVKTGIPGYANQTVT